MSQLREGSLQCLPITCLEVVGNYLLFGESSYISAIDLRCTPIKLSSNPEDKVSIFGSGYPISGIKAMTCGGDDNVLIFAYANKFGRLLKFENGGCNEMPLKVLQISNSDESGHSDPGRSLNFTEWIQAANWIKMPNKNNGLAILTALNCTSIWELVNDGGNAYQILKVSSHQYKNKSILYSGEIHGVRADELLIFSGTVYREILIWTPVGEADFKPLFRLEGHDGVIFSINFNPELMLLASTSDDRSLRLWSFKGTLKEATTLCKVEDILNGPNSVQVVCEETLYGHSARVWRSLWMNERIVTIGEDATICIWNLDGSISSNWRSHGGSSIWSCAYYKDGNILFTGGGDGSIIQKKLDIGGVSTSLVAIPLFNELDFPRSVIFYDSNNLLIHSDSGQIISHSLPNGSNTILFTTSRLSSYARLSLSPDRSKLLITNIGGHIFLLHLALNKESGFLEGVLFWNFESKESIVANQWLNDTKFIYSGLSNLKLFEINRDCNQSNFISFERMLSFPTKRPGMTTALLINLGASEEEYLLVGDELGGLWLYNLSEKSGGVCHFIGGVHGRYGSTGFLYKEVEKEVVTVGRNGLLKSWTIEGGKLIEISSEKMEFAWISRIFTIEGIGLVLVGFLSTDFIIYGWRERRILSRISCGGGHRSWDFQISDQNSRSNFVFIREKVIYSNTLNLNDSLGVYLKDGTHSRMINCGVYFEFGDNRHYFVTGGEDCSIRITGFELEERGKVIKSQIGVEQKHSSSVKSIKIQRWKDVLYMWSGGGKTHLVLWQISGGGGGALKWNEITSDYIGGAHNPDLRIMDIDSVFHGGESDEIFAICATSDGSGLIFKFNLTEGAKNRWRRMEKVVKLQGNGHCLTKIKYFSSGSFIFGTTSNGYLIVWEVELENSTSKPRATPATPSWSQMIHPSAITALDGTLVNSSEFLICTGGDDGAIRVHSLTSKSSGFQYKLIANSGESLTIPRSTLTCLQLSQNRIWGLSTDQILLLWDYPSHKVTSCNCGVPDPSYFIILETLKSVLCFGRGYNLIPFESLLK